MKTLLALFISALLTIVSGATQKPHAVIVVGTYHYSPNKTMPKFAAELERLGFRTTIVNPAWDAEKDKRGLPGLEVLAEADVALFFVRFLKLEDEQLKHITSYLESGKPVVGFRTSTHAFNYPAGHKNYGLNNDFGKNALGTPYQVHLVGGTSVKLSEGAAKHPILTGVDPAAAWKSPGTLYLAKPEPGVETLLLGTGKSKKTGIKKTPFGNFDLKAEMTDKIAWTWTNKWGGRSFYTSLGHVGDFAVPQSMRVMVNGMFWAADKPVPGKDVKIETFTMAKGKADAEKKKPKKKRPAKKAKPAPTTSLNILNVVVDKKWTIDTQEEWKENIAAQDQLEIKDGMVALNAEAKKATFQSKLKRFDEKQSVGSITFEQSPVWHNWEPTKNIGTSSMSDAPVLLSLGDDNYWMFARYKKGKNGKVASKPATLEGFDIPLLTNGVKHQYEAPGGLKPSQGGYHAWQSRDMINWVHHGPVTGRNRGWVTTAEYVDGKAYLYSDFPNDQDPHLVIDSDLTDGIIGEDMGMAFKDPTHGSDSAIIRDLDGKFHFILEDWSPIDASKHAWDSPLAVHAVSDDGKKDFKILAPPVDERTKPTGKFAEYPHRNWHADDPENYAGKPAPKDVPQHRIKKGDITAFGKYEIHTPEQNAYGDWAAIAVGTQQYLFCDYDPAGSHGKESMSVGWFTSSSINSQFKWCGNIGKGHPDPDVMFAEGRFYIATQTANDFVSPGPWVETVEVRVGVDTTNDAKIDQWSDWQVVKESYDYTPGFAKQIKRTSAAMDLTALPKGYGFQFEVKMTDTTKNKSMPILDKVIMDFKN